MKAHPQYHTPNTGGAFCDAPISEWSITVFRANYSAFNGYHRTPSNYSQLKCDRCGHFWRTKADYVGRVKFLKEGEAT